LEKFQDLGNESGTDHPSVWFAHPSRTFNDPKPPNVTTLVLNPQQFLQIARAPPPAQAVTLSKLVHSSASRPPPSPHLVLHCA